MADRTLSDDRSTQAPGAAASEQVQLSVVLPVFEEESTVGDLIPRLVDTLRTEANSFEIIAVDDGSGDGTLEVLRALRARYPDWLKVVRHLHNRGNGASLRTGARVARGEIVVFMDADGQHAPEDIHRLTASIPPFDLVIGARTEGYEGSWYRNAANRFYNRFASWLSQREVLDLTSGFRAMRRAAVMHFLPLYPSGFSAPTTTTLAFLKAGYNVAFVPIHVRQRSAGRSKIRLWHDGARFFVLILRMIMLYDPLRIFLPTSFVLSVLGVAAWIAGVLAAGRPVIPNATIFLFISALMIALLGLLANQIADTLITYHGDESLVIDEQPPAASGADQSADHAAETAAVSEPAEES